MKSKVKRKTPESVLTEGNPSAVILDIGEYRQMLERLEDLEDLNMLKEMRKSPLSLESWRTF